MLLARSLILFPLLSLFAAPPLVISKPEDVGVSAERLRRAASMLDGYIAREEIAGSVALYARKGRVVHLEAQGVRDTQSKDKMTADTIFRIASMTKPITSVAAMMLYEEGKFQLTDPISKWLPEFKNPKVAVVTRPEEPLSLAFRMVPAAREITVRDLLTHTSGLANPYNGVLIGLYDKMVVGERKATDTMADAAARLAKLPLSFEPGTAWAYGPSTDILGLLVERISGRTLEQFFDERIFKPLAMPDTHFYPPSEKESRFAPTYKPAQPKGIALDVPGRSGPNRKYFAGAGGLASTASDYFRFCQMLLNGGQFDGVRLLSPKTVQLMTANHIGKLPLWKSLDGYRFGLGFRVLTDLGESANLGSVGSYGWGGAFGTYFWIDPKDEAIGILMIGLRPYTHVNIRQDFQTMATQAIIE